jgi:cytochrome o ubiquinol oxidase subunit 2
MKKRSRYPFIVLSYLAVFFLIYLLLDTDKVALLNPQGMIAEKQKALLIHATWLMLIVVIPVFVLTFVVAWKYRADNKKATYAPDWDYNFLVECVWWGVPSVIIVFLAIITCVSSYELDPFKALDSKKKPLTIQVVALQWKWLFIYPEQKIATINYVQFPEKTPIHFMITGDAPMNSFWIPQLGGQVYAMNGMKTQLHLIADTLGSYNGSSANLSGKGFAGMKFVATSLSDEGFDAWVQNMKDSPNELTLAEYKEVAKPSENNKAASYVLEKEDLFDWIVMKFMMPGME